MSGITTEIALTSMNSTSTIGFLYKVENITLQSVDDTLQTTNSFVSREVIDAVNEKLKAQNFKVDEGSLTPRFVDGQLFLQGFAVEIKEPKTVGFLSGRG